MTSYKRLVSEIAAAVSLSVALASTATAQGTVMKPATPADWAALAKLPDFTGVWERFGGGGGAAAPPGPALAPAYEAKRKAYQASGREDSESANCLPPGMPTIMTQPYPMEFLLTPGKVTIVIEAYTQVRHIYTDGRKLPEDPDLEFHGTSVGRWDGDSLVVETIGFSPLTEIIRGVPHSGNMKIVERFRLTDPDAMAIQTTITDPEALTSPYVTNNSLRRHRDWTIAEYICEENNRNSVDAAGKARIDLTVPGGGRPTKN
jgi:hypothetical protein